MRVSGFTVIRNAGIMGYPLIPSIKSILPIVDEFIIGVGQSDDNTKELLASISDPKLKLFDSFWDTKNTKGGLILSEKTNEALARCQGDWCFYLQADEVVHEKDWTPLQEAMDKYRQDPAVEGLLFDYFHFYGSYQVIATSRAWYRAEVRVVKRSAQAQSVGDAQGFRIGDRKPRVKPAGASIYHYGWAKPPQKMGEKNKHMFRWWHGNKFDDAFDNFSYKHQYGLRPFRGTHPAVMSALVGRQNWLFKTGWTPSEWGMRDYKNLVSDVIEKLTGRRFGEHKNYTLLKE